MFTGAWKRGQSVFSYECVGAERLTRPMMFRVLIVRPFHHSNLKTDTNDSKNRRECGHARFVVPNTVMEDTNSICKPDRPLLHREHSR